MAVIGTGGQARYQVEMLARVRKFQRSASLGTRPGISLRHAQMTRQSARDFLLAILRLPNRCNPAVERADIVITVTASREPLVQAEWLKPGVTVIAVGSDGPDKQELDVEVLARADKVVADSLPQCLRLGEIHHAVETRRDCQRQNYAELGEITAGLKPGGIQKMKSSSAT